MCVLAYTHNTDDNSVQAQTYHVPMCVLAYTHITDDNSVQAQTYSRANVCASIYPHYR